MLGDALAPLFTSRTRARVLARLLASPRQGYGVRELARRVRLNVGGIQRELRRLHRLHLVRDARRGPGVSYVINEKHPFYADLRRLFKRGERLGRR